MRKDRHIWYPFAQQKLASEPVFLTHGKGAWLYDDQGNKYLDAISSWWTNIHGHTHPYLAEAAKKQFDTLEHVIFAGFTHAPAEELAERLLGRIPAMQKVFFSDNGSTAVEVGIKMALQYWDNSGKPKKQLIALEGAYHGDTFGSMSVSGRDAFTRPFRQHLFDTTYLPFPDDDNRTEVLQAMEEACASGDVAAFIFEPLVQGASGMRMYEAEMLDRLLSIASQHKVLCIADEVMTGFHRTGTFLATDQCMHDPDIICLSKGITGGSLPLAVTLCRQEIYDAFYSDDKMKALWHGHSYTGNPLACAIANASMDLLESAETQTAIHRIISQHQAFAEELLQQETIENIRQTGTIIAWDIVVEDEGYFSSIRNSLYDKALEQGVLLRPLGNTLYIMPPYCCSAAELTAMHNAGRLISSL